MANKNFISYDDAETLFAEIGEQIKQAGGSPSSFTSDQINNLKALVNGGSPQPVPTIVSWADGTDAEILAMIESADRGDLDLTTVWNVGDERVVHLDAINTYPSGIAETHQAKDVVLVLAAKDTGVADNTNPCYKYQYKTGTAGRTYPSFIVYQKTVMYSYGAITTAQSTGIGNQGWNGTPRRTWCNDYYSQALPSGLLPIFKEVILRQATAANAMQTSDGDKFFFPTEKEIQGARTYSPQVEADEFPQWQYFTDPDNKKDLAARWTRSAEQSAADYWCALNAAGSAGDSRPWGNNGLNPCGCI